MAMVECEDGDYKFVLNTDAYRKYILNFGGIKAIPGHLYFSKNPKLFMKCIWILESDYRFSY